MEKQPWMNQYIHKYYDHGTRGLRKVVRKILFSKRFIGYHQKEGGITEFSDFDSLANEVFFDVLHTYDQRKDNFDGYLYSSLYKAFIDELKMKKRKKRMNHKTVLQNGTLEDVAISDVSLDSPLQSMQESSISDVISNGYNLEDDIMGDIYDPKVEQYLNGLPVRQRKVAVLIMRGCSTKEIRQRLRITEKEYLDCMDGLKAYKNIKILF